MADPTAYTVGYDFSGFADGQPGTPLPGVKVDIELANIQTAISGLVDATKDVRRSDGVLKNSIVTVDSLSDTVKKLLGASSTDLQTVADAIADVSTVAGEINDVSTVAGVSADVTTVAGIATDVTGVAGISTSVSAVAEVAGDVTSVAGIADDVSAVADDLANINLKLAKSANLSDLADADTALVNLAGGDAATGTGGLVRAVGAAIDLTNATNLPDSIVTEAKLDDGAVTDAKVASDAAIAASKLSWTPAASVSTPAILTLSAELQRGFARPAWFAKDTDGTDYALSVQRAGDELAGLSPVGGTIILERGTHTLGTKIEVTGNNINIVGHGMGDVSNPPASAVDAPTTLKRAHADGPAIRFFGMSCSARDFQLDSDSTRQALSFDVDQTGIRFEATDTGTGLERVSGSYVHRVRVVNQPGDGVLLVGETTSSLLDLVASDGNKGMGFCIDGGERVSRTNVARPGIINLNTCRAQRNGGHAILAGSPNSVAGSLPYRVVLDNFECFGNADDSDVRELDAVAWLYGENITIKNSGFGGADADNVVQSHQGPYVAGTDIYLLNNRYIEATRCATIGERSGISTKNVVIDGVYTSATTAMTTAFVVTTGVQDVFLRQFSSSDYTNLITTSTSAVITTVVDGVWTFPP